jgi:serine/threonine protein kinase
LTATALAATNCCNKSAKAAAASFIWPSRRSRCAARVALKVIKLGMDTKSVIARFEAERQALAMMDHPNIAKVLDAGATETGRPYFVMELVRGIKITDYCDQNNLSTA